MYRVRTNQYTIEADSLEEFQNILSLLGIISDNKPKTLSTMSEKVIDQTPLPMETRLNNFYSLVSGASDRSLDILTALAKSPNGLSDVDLRSALGIEGSALGGSLGGLTKKAKDSGLSPQDILIKKPDGGYQLTNMMYKFMESKEPVRRAYPPRIPQQKEGAENI